MRNCCTIRNKPGLVVPTKSRKNQMHWRQKASQIWGRPYLSLRACDIVPYFEQVGSLFQRGGLNKNPTQRNLVGPSRYGRMHAETNFRWKETSVVCHKACAASRYACLRTRKENHMFFFRSETEKGRICAARVRHARHEDLPVVVRYDEREL